MEALNDAVWQEIGRAEEKKKREKEKSIRDEKLTLDKVIFYAR